MPQTNLYHPPHGSPNILTSPPKPEGFQTPCVMRKPFPPSNHQIGQEIFFHIFAYEAKRNNLALSKLAYIRATV